MFRLIRQPTNSTMQLLRFYPPPLGNQSWVGEECRLGDCHLPINSVCPYFLFSFSLPLQGNQGWMVSRTLSETGPQLASMPGRSRAEDHRAPKAQVSPCRRTFLP